jgi:hypothetical protein
VKAHQQTIGMNDEWLTPHWILRPLGLFDLDPCAPVKRPWPTAVDHYTILDDGLKREWRGRVWLNPPFSRYERPKWMAKMAAHNNGIMLVPAACETEAFQKYVFGKASGILMLSKRPHFCDVAGNEASANSGCTICLVAYGKKNLDAPRTSGLGIILKEMPSMQPCATDEQMDEWEAA